MRAVEFLTELFDNRSVLPIEWDTQFAPQELHADAYDRQGKKISMSFINWGQYVVEIEFTRGGSHDVTGEGDAPIVFATVINMLQEYLQKYPVNYIIFSGSSNTGSRAKFYNRLISRFAPAAGFVQVSVQDLPPGATDMLGSANVFALKRKDI